MTRQQALQHLRALADRDTRTHPLRDHPWMALAAAAGIGLALGVSPQLRRTALRAASHWVN
ncbi:MAG: hypothetical protein IT445_08080 [Phycisphaeraceae bacterium]|nr:hypothetical protein [Phycisphaeraceae bacterium]